jgi:transcriptional regulator with XRE-family HTH domain
MGVANHYKASFDLVVGERLRELRTTAGLTQGQVAYKIGIPRGTYANWECGESGMTLHTAIKVASALGVTVAELTPEPAVALARSTVPKAAGRPSSS